MADHKKNCVDLEPNYIRVTIWSTLSREKQVDVYHLFNYGIISSYIVFYFNINHIESHFPA